jgi:hypothetical protein
MTQAIDVHSLESSNLLIAASHSPPIGIPRSAQHRRIQSSKSLIDNFLKAVTCAHARTLSQFQLN